jgi:rhodanese-related sulfurtransferase
MMAPFPLLLTEILGKYGAYFVYLLIGIGFGYALEISGFGNSRKLAAQFYFKEMTVLKVMFSAIVVAMVLVFLASGLGLLDYNLVWVNPTYLWPGIIGGLIMGVGFIIGGFCPGTSLVALATFKSDGLFFAGGVLFGIFLFGETVQNFDIFFFSSYLGRLTLPDWLGISTGWVVLIIVLMALFMFWGSEQLERIFGGMDPKKAPKSRYIGAGVLVLVAIVVILIGQPTTEDRWTRIAPEKQSLLVTRSVQIHPGELLTTIHDHKLNLVMLDIRDEVDFNLFHIADARKVSIEDLHALTPELHLEPANTVFVVMSNDETAATEAWKILQAESVPNVYILEGGINNWLGIFAADEHRILALDWGGDDELRYDFVAALGAAYPSADPHIHDWEEIEYEPKIKLELKRAPVSGGCG